MLEINPSLVDAEIRWEEVDGEKYPHIYGALNLDAVQAEKTLERDQNGVYITFV